VPRRPRVAAEQLLLERREEALGDSVVVAVALRAHRDGDAAVAGLLAERERHVLTTLIEWCTSPGPGAGGRAIRLTFLPSSRSSSRLAVVRLSHSPTSISRCLTHERSNSIETPSSPAITRSDSPERR
jgi:hypothetical protein